MAETPNLGLPYLLAAQSQKHVTHNDAIRALDALVQIAVLDRNLATPPASPADGDRYIVDSSPTGAWAGHAGSIAAFQDGAWMFYPPNEGWLAWIADESVEVVFNGTAWVTLSSGGGGGGVTDHGALTGLADDDHPQYHTNARGDARYTPIAPVTLGINATADTTNRLTLGSAASLFNHAGSGGHQLKINKATAGDTASFLFQTGFSGRAELGTSGDDDFHFKVSANGTAWNEALVINRTTGACTFPNSSVGSGTVTNVATGTGLTGGPIVTTGTISLANMPATTIKGNAAGSAAAPADLTAVQVTAMLEPLTGDSGSGGSKGLAPAPASGDAAAGKFLKADGTWALPPTASGVPDGDKGDITVTSGTWTIDANVVSHSKLAQMPAGTIKGNNAGSTANAGDLTIVQVQAMLAASPTVQTFTSSGTWTKPAGCRRVRVRVVGGGGGGGGATAAASQCCAASGGGSGGFGEGIYDVTSTSSLSVTVGAGGAGGVAANGTGGNGGTTSFGALLSANGGFGGAGMTSGTAASYVTAATAAAAGSGGSINAGGNCGLPGHRASATIFMSGQGAPSYLGGGGRGTNFAAAGSAGGASGAGGAGAASSSATGFVGGAGAAGLVIVEEFY
jgi:hypothetical protein